MTSIKQQALKGVKWTSISTLIVTILQILQLIILARLLKPEDYGLMAMVAIVIGFAQSYTDLGVSAAIIHRQDATREQLSSLYWLNIICGAIIFIIVMVLSPLLANLFKETYLVKLLPVVALTFLISPWGIQFQMLLQKELRFNLLARQEIISAFFAAVVAITAAVLGQGVWSLVWGQLTGVTVKTVLLIRIAWNHWKPMVRFRHRDLDGFLSFGLFQMGERSINFLAARLDQLLIGTLLGSQALGFYNFAYRLVIEPVGKINPVITRVAFPAFSMVQDNVSQLRTGYLTVTKVLGIINAPLQIGIIAVAPIAVPLIFGQQWNPAVVLVQILAVVAFLKGVGNPIGSLLLAKGRADWGFYWNIFVLLVTIPFVFIGAKLGGSTGIALAVLSVSILLSFANYYFLVRNLIGRCGQQYFWAFGKPFLLAGLMGMIVVLVGLLPVQAVWKLVIQVNTGAIIYIHLMWLFDKRMFGMTKEMLFSK